MVGRRGTAGGCWRGIRMPGGFGVPAAYWIARVSRCRGQAALEDAAAHWPRRPGTRPGTVRTGPGRGSFMAGCGGGGIIRRADVGWRALGVGAPVGVPGAAVDGLGALTPTRAEGRRASRDRDSNPDRSPAAVSCRAIRCRPTSPRPSPLAKLCALSLPSPRISWPPWSNCYFWSVLYRPPAPRYDAAVAVSFGSARSVTAGWCPSLRWCFGTAAGLCGAGV